LPAGFVQMYMLQHTVVLTYIETMYSHVCT